MPRYLLDTNLLREVLTPGNSLEKYHRLHPDELTLRIVAVRETLRGFMAVIGEAESSNDNTRLSSRYALLKIFLEGLRGHSIHTYKEQADTLYKTWPQSIRRIGPNDCRIAASAAVDGLIVLTRNTSDFERIAQHEPRIQFATEPAHDAR